MGYSKTVIILPGYGLDNLPYDIDDQQATGLLNAFAIACHPTLLAQSDGMPSWSSCDEHADIDPGTLFIIPPVSEDNLYGNWVNSGEPTSGVIRGIGEREELAAAVLAEIGASAEGLDTDLVADCMAIGVAHALMELLTQQMHYFTNIDAEVLGQNTIAAAKAIVAGDSADAKAKLTVAYEVLVEARERFYPVDCFLVDLCLLNAEQANQHLIQTLNVLTPINLLIEGQELDKFDANTIAAIQEGLATETPDQEPRVAVLGGEHTNVAAPLVPLADWLRDFQAGMEGFGARLGELPTAWARKRFGFSTLLPQVLKSFGFESALHFALDDGTFPDAEHSKLSWEGSDGTQIDAMTRIPVAIESASAFLQLPQRIAESMQDDMVAAILFARWPDVKTPWLSDFQRIHNYGDVFGRFVTLNEFAADSGESGNQSQFEAREYLSPFLIQGSALGQKRPISRFTQAHQQRARLDAAIACRTITRLIQNTNELDQARAKLEQSLVATDEQQPISDDGTAALTDFTRESIADLAKVCGADTSSNAGLFVFNPLSFARRVDVELPNNAGTAIAELPALGFAWVDSPSQPETPSRVPLATKSLLHNGLFEVHISQETGGISTIKGFARSPNRLSQQIAFRFENPVQAGADEDGDPIRTSYSTQNCTNIQVTRCDALVGEIEATGTILDPRDQSRMANFKQVVRVVHGSPFVEVNIELSDLDHFPEGNPWLCYYGCRFAWNDSAAALTRSVFGQAHGFSGERFESPHYLEIASDDLRTTIINHGMPFYRKTDMRMADSIMIVESEDERRFRFTIAIDQPYPQQAALNAMTPPLTVPTGKPAAGPSGWFARLSAKNVVITEYPDSTRPDTATQTFRFMETEGRAVNAKFACFKPATAARKVDFQGNEVQQLVVEPDGSVTIDFRKYELCDVQIDF